MPTMNITTYAKHRGVRANIRCRGQENAVVGRDAAVRRLAEMGVAGALTRDVLREIRVRFSYRAFRTSCRARG